MDFKIYSFLFLIFVLFYEKVWRISICKRKIKEKILTCGGEIRNIEKLTPREEIYYVDFVINDEKRSATVKFSFFYNENWY